MNLVIGIIVATVVIAVMIAIQIISFESALKERLKPGRSGDACDEKPCFGGCGSDKFDTTSSKRSTPHAS